MEPETPNLPAVIPPAGDWEAIPSLESSRRYYVNYIESLEPADLVNFVIGESDLAVCETDDGLCYISESDVWSDGFLAQVVVRGWGVAQREVPADEVEFRDGDDQPVWKTHPAIVLSDGLGEPPESGDVIGHDIWKEYQTALEATLPKALPAMSAVEMRSIILDNIDRGGPAWVALLHQLDETPVDPDSPGWGVLAGKLGASNGEGM